jgi:glycyl-tRNA synthetase beta chain
MKLSPDGMAAKLSGVTFRERLGSMAGKTSRVKKLAMSFAAAAGLSEESKNNTGRGAELAKADLTSEIIFEYPELCGIAGAIYAKNAGENDTVVSIIREHYRPSPADGDGAVPSGAEASIVAIADRADTIAADFALGIIPTGSEDPYGLRRAAAGLLKILLEKKMSLPLNLIFTEALRELSGDENNETKKLIAANIRDTLSKILDFMRQRIETIFQEGGFVTDEIRSALAAGFDDVPDAAARIDALSKAKRGKAFEQIIVSLKRAANIIRQAQKVGKGDEIFSLVPALFVEKEETELSAAIDSLVNNFENFKKSKDYLGALNLLSGLSVPLENFFNKVMVMAPEENLRRNRLALLARIVERYRLIADFSELKSA